MLVGQHQLMPIGKPVMLPLRDPLMYLLWFWYISAGYLFRYWNTWCLWNSFSLALVTWPLVHLSADLHTQTPEAEAEREQMFVQRFQWVACAKIRLRFEFRVEQLKVVQCFWFLHSAFCNFFSFWLIKPHPPWFCLAQAWVRQNQRKNVKHATNWAIRTLVEKSPKLENTSILA